jgi:biopolymer transport protein ExbD
MRFSTRLKSSNTLVDLTPLVDVVFLMLVFFICTSDILPLKSLPIQNPKLPISTTPLTSQLFVVMDRTEVIYLGSKRKIVDLLSLPDQLHQEVELFAKAHGGVKPTIVLSVDEHVPYSSFLQLYSVCATHARKIKLVYQTV